MSQSQSNDDWFLYDLENTNITPCEIDNSIFYVVYLKLLDYYDKKTSLRLARIVCETPNLETQNNLLKALINKVLLNS